MRQAAGAPISKASPWPRTRKCPHSPRLAEKSTKSSACHNFGVRAPNKKHKKSRVGSEPWLRPAEFLGFRPRGELKRRPLAYLTGRQPVTPVDGARSGARARISSLPLPGSFGHHRTGTMTGPGGAFPGLGLAGAGNARGRTRGLSAPVGSNLTGSNVPPRPRKPGLELRPRAERPNGKSRGGTPTGERVPLARAASQARRFLNTVCRRSAFLFLFSFIASSCAALIVMAPGPSTAGVHLTKIGFAASFLAFCLRMSLSENQVAAFRDQARAWRAKLGREKPRRENGNALSNRPQTD